MIHFKPQKTSYRNYKVRPAESSLKGLNSGKENICTFNTGILKSDEIQFFKEPGTKKKYLNNIKGS